MEGVGKTGSPFGRVTMEDYSGTYDLMLFGRKKEFDGGNEAKPQTELTLQIQSGVDNSTHMQPDCHATKRKVRINDDLIIFLNEKELRYVMK
jgi:hypothetical protein